MNVRMRIWAGFAAVAALTALLGAFSVAGFMSSSKALNELAEMNGDAQLAAEINADWMIESEFSPRRYGKMHVIDKCPIS